MYPRIGWYFGIVGLIFQAALVVFAIRAYRASRRRATLLAMLAAICYVMAASSWYTFPFTAGLFLRPHLSAHAGLVLADSRYYFEQTFQILFAVFMIAALLFQPRPMSKGNRPSQAIERRRTAVRPTS